VGLPATPATGTITATGVIVEGLTDANGIVQTTTFPFTNPQDTLGKARKGTSTVFYKTSPMLGTITTEGLEVSAFMVNDE